LDDSLSEEEQFEAVPLLWSKYSEYLKGHRVRTVTSEIMSTSETRFSRGSGIELIELAEVGHFLACATRRSVADFPSSVGFQVFNYAEPVLRLRETDQELLLAALKGGTDEDLGSTLRLTQDAVKARWRAVFARIAEAKPDLVEDDGRVQGRGRQKRHRVLGYLREHLEELRPYDWRAR
jgi:hypothetical protein